MKSKNRNRCILKHIIVLLAAASMGIAACQSDPVVYESNTGLTGKETLLILPFKDLTRIYSEDGVIKCPVCNSFFTAGEVSSESLETLSRVLVTYFKENTGFKIKESGTIPELMLEPIHENRRPQSEKQLIIEAGRQHRCPRCVLLR